MESIQRRLYWRGLGLFDADPEVAGIAIEIFYCTPMIRLQNVQKVYPPEHAALDGVTLAVVPGEFLFIAGASGAGKSTLLRLLFGAEQCSAGEVIVGGQKMGKLDRQGIAFLRREIGFVFQDYKLLEKKTIIENVTVPLEVRGIPRSAAIDLAARMLQAFGLDDKGSAFPLQLSGGEQQRVALARALIHKPRLIIADEPTGNLDPEMARKVFDLLLEANAHGVTVVVATHDLAMIESLNLRTIVLDNGKIIGDFERPRRLH